MSYLSVGSAAQGVELKVQELVLGVNHAGNIIDGAVMTASGSTVTIDVGQPISYVTNALFIDNSAATVAPVTYANRVVSGNTVVLTLSAAAAADDTVILYFVVSGPAS